jgi:hypothetical protein
MWQVHAVAVDVKIDVKPLAVCCRSSDGQQQ